MCAIDGWIIGIYLVGIAAVGLLVSRKAANSTDDYFLGARSLPWWLLGISGMASFIDVGSTALVSSWFFLIGVKAYWYMFNGHLALLLAFQMIFVAKWLRRSRCATNAQWMIGRFGKGSPGNAARIVTAILALAIAIGFMPLFWQGAGKVLAGYIPAFQTGATWLGENLAVHISANNLAALCFFSLIAVYTVASGFYGVVYTDFVQSILILFMLIYFAVLALRAGIPDAPAGWFDLNPFAGEPVLPRDYGAVESVRKVLAQLPLLGPLAVLWIANNVFQGFATPFDAWTAQRYYAARNEGEASKVAAQWISLTSLRYLMLPAVAILALPLAAKIADPEKAMSIVFAEVLPAGISGIMLAALIAAGMSTVDTTVNSCAAYYVSDIHKPFLRPSAGKKELMWVSYLVSFSILFFGGLLGVFGTSIGSIWDWIIMGLFVGTLPPNIVKWFWWRANGWGFAGGCAAGLIAALVVVIPPLWTPLYTNVLGLFNAASGLEGIVSFVFVFLVSTIGTLVFTLATPPTDMATLEAFYRKTRPFGFWGAVRSRVEEGELADIHRENRRDLWLLPVACLWQFSLFTLWGFIVLQQWHVVGVIAVTLVICSVILYKYWYCNLKCNEESAG